MKKLLSSLLVLALLLTMVVPAFAATPSDVVGKTSEEAVARLMTLGVLNGYPDGTFQPEKTITRAEFAKIVAYAAGFASAAEYLGSVDTSFKDVKKDNGYGWASGYISVAANKGYLKGYPDGTFKPANNVTYAEVATVLLRVLGYNDNLTGTWPSNYIIKADELGLIGDVAFVGSGAATRGDVAIMTNETLHNDLVTWDKDLEDFYGITLKKGDVLYFVTLQEKAFPKASEQNGVVLTAPALDKDGKISLNQGKVATTDSFTVVGSSLSDLYGREVNVLKYDGKVAVVVDAQDSDLVVTGTLQEDLTVRNDVYGAALINLNDVKDNYDVVEGALFSVNEEIVGSASVLLAKNTEVTLFLNEDDEVRFVLAGKYAIKGLAFDRYTSATSYKLAKIYFQNGSTVEVTKNAEITVDGEAATLADLEEYNVLHVVTNLDGEAIKVEAVTDSVTGVVTKVRNDEEYTIAGKTYVQNANFEVKDSLTIDLDDEVTLYLDKAGKAAYAVITEDATTDSYVYVKSVDGNRLVVEDGLAVERDVVKVYNKDGATVTYNVYRPDADFTSLDAEYVKVSFDEDGFVNGVDALTAAKDAGTVQDVTASTITVDTTTYKVTDSTVVLNVVDTNSPKLSSFSAVKKGYAVTAVVNKDGIKLDAILVTGGTAAADELDTVSGLFVGAYKDATATETTYSVELSVDGEIVLYDVTSATYTKVKDLDENTLVVLVDGTDKADGLYGDATVALAKNTVASIDNDTKTFVTNGSEKFVVTTATLVYVIDVDGNVTVGDFSDVLDLDGAVLATDANLYVASSGDTLGTYSVVQSIVIEILQ